MTTCHLTSLADFCARPHDRGMDDTGELEQVNAAIAGILRGGQSFTINSGGASRTVTNADYAALLKRKEALESRLAAGAGALSGRIGCAW